MSAVGQRLRHPLAASLLISILVFVGVMGLRSAGSLEALELTAYDWYLRLRLDDSEADSRIVLITITESDIQNQGRWPLTDATLARVLRTLARYRPRAIGLDIYRDLPVPPGQEELEALLTGNRHIIVVRKFGEGVFEGIPPPPVLQKTEQVGFNDILVDRDGIVRRGLLFLTDEQGTAYSFPLRLALLYLQEEGIVPRPDTSNRQHIRLGEITIRPFESRDGGYVDADASGYQFLLDYKGARKSLASFSLTALLSDEIDPKAIEDKIVLIGVTAESVPDIFNTPYSSGIQAGRRMPGVVLHAHIVSQLLRFGLDRNSPIATANERQETFWILIWGMLGGALGLWVRSPWSFSLAGVIGLLALACVGYIALQNGWWIPLVPPGMTWLTSAAIVAAYMSNLEKKQRGLLMQLFSKHVSQEVAEDIWQRREQFFEGGRLRSQRLIATVLFTDLVGFTSVSEKFNPQGLMDWLNEYMEGMAGQVMDHGGVINKYIGDSIMAIFGVPMARNGNAEISQDAVNAVNCALAMERMLIQLNNRWLEQDQPTIGMRVGIFTGPLVAGSLGSVQRLEYTVIGDTVNTASRLESFDKNLFPHERPCRILIGEATFRHLGRQFETEKVGEVSLKGKDEKITVYRIIGQARSSGGALQEEFR